MNDLNEIQLTKLLNPQIVSNGVYHQIGLNLKHSNL